jgi:putative glutamine amidotransferase
MKPIIGISAKYSKNEQVGLLSEQGVQGEEWHLISNGYIRSVTDAGGIPVILPIYSDPEQVLKVLPLLHGILLSGGSDISPSVYGETAIDAVGETNALLDAMELGICKEILGKSELPVLGICRGLQIINIAFGGTLYQDLSESTAPSHPSLGDLTPRWTIAHEVQIEEKSLLNRIVGKKNLNVNSFHHQSVRTPGKGLKISARSADGTIEAMEGTGKAFLLGVQWHPEMMAPDDSISDPDSKELFRYFNHQSAEYAATKTKSGMITERRER